MKFLEMSNEGKAEFLHRKGIIRMCYLSHDCCLCDIKITMYQKYFDCGCGKRAHETCVYKWLG